MRLLLSFALEPQSKCIEGLQGVCSQQCWGVFFSRFLSHGRLCFSPFWEPLWLQNSPGQAYLHLCGHCHLLAGSEPIEPFSWKWFLLFECPKVSLQFQALAHQIVVLYTLSAPSHLQMQLHPGVWLCWGSQVHSTRGAGRSDGSVPQSYPLPRPMPILRSCLVACGALGGRSFLPGSSSKADATKAIASVSQRSSSLAAVGQL